MEELLDYTEVFVWGQGARGQLGNRTDDDSNLTTPRLSGFGLTIRMVACGDEHTIFLTDTNQVYAMGSNDDGRLGLGDASVKDARSPALLKDLSQLRISSIVCGGAHSAVITHEGLAFAWGKGDSGALGSGNSQNLWSPQAMKLPGGIRVRQISCGARHTALLAITSDSKGTLLTCGWGDFGQLGTGSRSAGLLTPVHVEGEVKQVSCGVVHTAFTTYAGKIYAMGGNALGQLGTGNKQNSRFPVRVRTLEGVFIEKVACGHHTAALSDKGELYIWGTGAFGERLLPWKVSIPVPLRDLEVGGCFGAAIDVSKRVWTWGTNANGELGQGDFKQRKTPTLIQSLGKKGVRSLACGSAFVVALGMDVRSKGREVQRDHSPFSKYNLPLVRSRPFSEIQTPRSHRDYVFESPNSLKVAGPRSPSEIIYSPRKDQEIIPEAIESDLADDSKVRFGAPLNDSQQEGLVSKVRTPREESKSDISQGEKSIEEVSGLKYKLQMMESEVGSLNRKIESLGRDLEREKAAKSIIETQLIVLQTKQAEDTTFWTKKLQTKDEELASALAAQSQSQAICSQLTVQNEYLLKNLQEERNAKERLHQIAQEIDHERHELLQKLQEMQSFTPDNSRENGLEHTFNPPVRKERTPPQRIPPKPSLPQLNLDLISKAKSKKERTLRLLNSVTPAKAQSPSSSINREEELNMRYEDLEESPRLGEDGIHHERKYSQSVASMSDIVTQDCGSPLKGSPLRTQEPAIPLTDRPQDQKALRQGQKPRLRDNISALKSKLKALNDNKPVLESKMTAFERRLRGGTDRS